MVLSLTSLKLNAKIPKMSRSRNEIILPIFITVFLLFIVFEINTGMVNYNFLKNKINEYKMRDRMQNFATLENQFSSSTGEYYESLTLNNQTLPFIAANNAVNGGDYNTNYFVSNVDVSLMERVKAIVKCKNVKLQHEVLQYGSYWLIRNLIIGTKSRNIDCASAITYTTIGDYTFMAGLPMIVERWRAPISFALYTPGYDFKATMTAIQYMRNCAINAELIRQYVSFHVYFPNNHMPQHVTHSEEAALKWPFDCSVATPPHINVNRSLLYKTKNKLTFPINVARNIARMSVNTHFVFPCDIELIPSNNLVTQFLEMIVKTPEILGNETSLRVFTMPLFEIQKDAELPENKMALLYMLKKKQALPFHQHLCEVCHKVPHQNEWLNETDDGVLSVTAFSKRIENYKSWEPFYISDNREPLFDERVTWEGQSNKRVQGYAMCLMDYEYHVLHPAFLTHLPGVKHKTKNRFLLVPAMNSLINNKIKPEYKILYGNNKKCTI